jgi:Xaa-Pro aminopeptidase
MMRKASVDTTKTPAQNASIPPHCAPDECERRLEQFTRLVAKAKFDAFVVFTEINRLYLTGLKSGGVLVVQPGAKPQLFCDSLYIEMARQQVHFADVHLLRNFPKQVGGLAKKMKWKTVAYEGSINTFRYQSLREAMPKVEKWVESEGMLRDLRAIKSPSEQNAIRRAVHLADRVLMDTMEKVEPGMREWDVRRELLTRIIQSGAEGESFDAIIAAGSNASKPHADVTQRVLRPNQILLIDMGVRLQHYCSDMTRTFFFGKPSPKMHDLYKVVLEAQLKAIRAIRAGRTGGDIDHVARRVIEKAGYGPKFCHSLGHGIGLEVHEGPGLGARNQTVLEPGMVVTVEPGIYLPGVGGVRIEDIVIVRKDGCEVLTTTPKELTYLPN